LISLVLPEPGRSALPQGAWFQDAALSTLRSITMEVLADDPVDILFLEEDSDLGELYSYKLQLDGYRVTVAKPAGDRLELGGRPQPDIIFIEVSPTDPNSLAAFKALRRDRRTRTVPVVVLSHARQPELREHGVKLGELDYLVSPPLSISLSAVTEEGFVRPPLH
jgi:response regulator RpfG family c-di-GMP phosphodiesterase